MNKKIWSNSPIKNKLCTTSFLIIFSLTLSACVTTAKTADEMKANDFAKVEACINRSSEDVARFVREKLETCRESSFSAGPLMNNDTWVESSAQGDGTQRVSLIQKANWNKFYMQLIEVKKTNGCQALVTVYGMMDNKGWFKESENIINWINEWNAEC